MVSIYGASRLKHSSMWLELKKTEPDINWTAHWPSIVGKIPDTPEYATAFWIVDYNDIVAADAVIVYAELNDPLRGAIFEAGLAIGMGKRVCVIGSVPDYGSWQFSERVLRSTNMAQAIWMLRYIYDRD